jgi:hypothetical protein
MNDYRIRQILREELNKSDVNSIVSNKINSMYSSRDFKKNVKEIVADAISELYKVLWQKNGIWKPNVSA